MIKLWPNLTKNPKNETKFDFTLLLLYNIYVYKIFVVIFIIKVTNNQLFNRSFFINDCCSDNFFAFPILFSYHIFTSTFSLSQLIIKHT